MWNSFKHCIRGAFRRVDEQVKDIKVHDYRNRYWGHDYTISGGGVEVSIMGWGNGIRKGDRLLLESRDNPFDGGAMYVVDTISYFSDPTDMWKATATFLQRHFCQDCKHIVYGGPCPEKCPNCGAS